MHQECQQLLHITEITFTTSQTNEPPVMASAKSKTTPLTPHSAADGTQRLEKLKVQKDTNSFLM